MINWETAPEWATGFAELHGQAGVGYFWVNESHYLHTSELDNKPYCKRGNHRTCDFNIIEERPVETLPQNCCSNCGKEMVWKGLQNPHCEHCIEFKPGPIEYVPEFTFATGDPDALKAGVNERRYIVKWDGEGLPPVGTKCRLFNCGNESEGVINYISDTYCIFQEGFSEQHYHMKSVQFKPLKTEREKILVDMTSTIRDDCDGCFSSNMKEGCESLIKAGYRKFAPFPYEVRSSLSFNNEGEYISQIGFNGKLEGCVIRCVSNDEDESKQLRDEILKRLSC